MAHTALAFKSHSSTKNPSVENLLRRGESSYGDGNLDEAEALFRQALETDPDNVEALNNLGVVSHRRGRREAAISLFTRALLHDFGGSDAAQNILTLAAEMTQKELATTARYAFPYLLVRFKSGDWGNGDSQFLSQAAGALETAQKSVLFDCSIGAATGMSVRLVIDILRTLARIDLSQLEKLGNWMQNVELSREERDEFEQLICVKGDDDQAVRQYARRDGYYRDGFFAPGWERYPRRIVAPAETKDPFMKLVPPGAPSKAGGMRVLIVSDFNIAGQCTALMRALNRYTNHMARCVILQDDYLSYDKDVLIRDQKGTASASALAEACGLIPKADFFHFGRGLLEFSGIDWRRYISPQNCVFQYYGSELRDNGPAVAAFHAKTHFPAITAVDLTMYRLLPASYYHIQPYMLEMDDLPQVNWDIAGTIRLCHAPSSANYRKIKRTDLILEVMNRVVQERPGVESVLIENMSNAECLAAKSRCHVHIVSLLTVFGLNAIESAAMRLVPICGVDNFSRLIYPDSPIPNASAENIYEVVRRLVDDPVRTKELGDACREWVRPEFDARKLVRKYWYLYDVIYNGLSVDYPEIF